MISNFSKDNLVPKDSLIGDKKVDMEKCILITIKKMLTSIQMSDDQKNDLISHLNEFI